MSNHYTKAAVRTSLLHFIFGKAFNGIISLLTLIMLARWMAPDAYGVYIAFLALQISLLAVSSLGIETTAERFLPELRTHHADSELLGFVMAAMVARLGTLLVLVLIAWFAAQPITALIGLEQYSDIFRIWIVVIGLTGMFSFTVALLEAMLHQRHAQRCISIYVFIKFMLIGLANQHLHLDIEVLVHIELIATGMAALVSAWALVQHFPTNGIQNGWQMVLENRKRMKHFAIFNYTAQIVFQLFNAQIMKLLVTKLLGVLQAASYGFAYSLTETVQRYLPAVLLLRLIKPVFVNRYVKTRDFRLLNEMARIILKLNLLILAPIIVFSAMFGSDLLAILSNDKYGDAHWILVGLLALLVPASHQLVLSLLAGTLEKNAMQLYAGIASCVAFPCALLFIPEWGPMGAMMASAVSSVVYNIFATIYLRRAGFDYRPDVRGVGVFVLAGIALYGLSLGLQIVLSGWAGITTVLLLGSATYLILVRVMSAFTHEERALLNSILPKRVFIF